MDKRSIAGIVLMALIFVGFAFYTSKQQKDYQQKLAEYNAYVAEKAAAEAENAASDAYSDAAVTEESAAKETDELVELFGETLAASLEGDEELVIVENDFLILTISGRGGRIIGAELKDYTKYGPRGERNEKIQLFDPKTVIFDLSFYVKNGTRNVEVNTSEHYFDVQSVIRTDSSQVVVMSLPIAEDARLVYKYTVHDTDKPSRGYMVDFDVTLENAAPYMARQSNISILWDNVSYQNERGFKNENMRTTIAYRLPGESSISELAESDGTKRESVSSSVNWVAFKQQYFSSVFIARNNFMYADMGYVTEQPDSGYIKNFAAHTSVPYDEQTDGYEFSFYFGPNKYAILKDIKSADGESLAMERLVPLGWGIFGWVNRWFTIPVFDFLRRYIGSFGLIILILAVLVRIIIFPLTYKSYLSTAKMRVIKPEMDALNAKYPNQEDAMKKQQAMMELYKKAGINPLGGCLPMLIQMPILIAMFRFFPASIELRGQSFLWADDLSSYDSVLDLPFNIPFYGDHVSLFTLLMTVMLFVFSWMNYKQTASSQPQMFGMKFMMVYMMPVMMLFAFNDYASGLCYYYFVSTALSMIQTWGIRYMVDDNKIHAMMQANAAKKSNGKKSRFQQRYEELMRQQEAAARKNGKRK